MSAPATTPPPAGGFRRIVLVADDTPAHLAMLSELLQPLYTVRVANCGRRALTLARLEPLPDLVLLDIMMPDMSGYDVLQELRADPGTADIPAVFVTGLDSGAEEQRGLELGAADYIVKPINSAVVLARVHTQLELKRARDQLRAQNRDLAEEVDRRRRAESEVRELNAALAAHGEALERTLANLESFSYNVSHDLRAPLRAIDGFARLLEESDGDRLSSEGRAHLDRVLGAARRMSRMIDDILAYSRAERAVATPAPVALGAIVADVVRDLRPSYPATRIDVGALPTVQADGAMLRQVLANLIDNACKFSSKRADPRVEVGTVDTPEGPAVFVRDNGAGFPAEESSRLFGLFQRLHAEKEFTGTGVGLAVVRRLVERHGGSVTADSRLGGPTTFRFTLGPEASA
jgi:two-component system, sensor histidine kinase and response regulator